MRLEEQEGYVKGSDSLVMNGKEGEKLREWGEVIPLL